MTYKNKTKNVITFRTVAAFCTVFILTTGIVFAKDIGNFLNNLFNLSSINLNNDSVVNAIENEDYIQSISMNYIDINNNYKIKADYLMLDDINLYIVFNLYSNNTMESNYRLSLLDLEISDNNGNVLYNASNLNSIQNNKFISIPGWKNISTNNNEIRELFFLISNGLPNMESLNIKFSRTRLYNHKDPINDYININSECNFTIDLIDKFINRDIIEYEISEYKNDKYELQKCIATNTGLYLLYKTTNSNTNFKLLNTDITYDRTVLGMNNDKNYYFVTQYHITKDELEKLENIELLDINNKKLILNKIN